jgi:hypothetical protein
LIFAVSNDLTLYATCTDIVVKYQQNNSVAQHLSSQMGGRGHHKTSALRYCNFCQTEKPARGFTQHQNACKKRKESAQRDQEAVRKLEHDERHQKRGEQTL